MSSGRGLLIACFGVVAVLSQTPSVLPPDNTGLVGAPPAPDRPLLPLRFWENPRKSPLKPRRKDLDEPTLLRLMGQDFDSKWMRRTPPHHHVNDATDEGERKTVRALRELVEGGNHPRPDYQYSLPEGLPIEYHEMMKTWLVRQATCPIHYVWDDLGTYFWPRWIRRGECGSEEEPRHNNSLVRDGDAVTTSGRDVSGSTGTSSRKSCSWPPGMLCTPGVARNLHILRWHCRLRKKNTTNNNNNVWTADRLRKVQDRRKKKRKKYRCMWLKVPYPVPEDCVCSC
uniref:Noggin n=1 Tax=Timema genevievae TaxID=629358 RepID=A0A7R9K292_TIMGE|nr:unnamed protein product [Timema genevievae]